MLLWIFFLLFHLLYPQRLKQNNKIHSIRRHVASCYNATQFFCLVAGRDGKNCIKFALCVFSLSQPSTWEAYLGLKTQKESSSEVQRRSLKQIIPHPHYNHFKYTNDIALMELDKPVAYTEYIRPICLPSPQHIFEVGKQVYVTGWGALREGGE